jgi:DNA repair exonuclease SbcCD ATPase subunit
MKENIHKQIENKFFLIEKRLKNSFQAIKKDNDSIKGKIQILEDSCKELDIKQDFEAEITELKKGLSENKEKTNSLESKISKKDIKEQVKKEIFPIFETKLKSFAKKEKIDSELNKLRDSFEELKKANEKNLIELDRKNREEIKKLKKQISYLKGRTKNFPEKKGFFSSIVDSLADEKEVPQTIVIDPSKREEHIVKKKNILNKLIDSLSD